MEVEVAELLCTGVICVKTGKLCETWLKFCSFAAQTLAFNQVSPSIDLPEGRWGLSFFVKHI